MESAIHTEIRHGYRISIFQDTDPMNPRTDYDNAGTMVCFHSRYNLGDKHNFTLESAREFSRRKDIICLPLFLYDHSGITINTTGFSCPWDSGQVGFIYITKAKALKEWGVDINHKKDKEYQSQVETAENNVLELVV